jgi:iron complex transport system permease protein
VIALRSGAFGAVHSKLRWLFILAALALAAAVLSLAAGSVMVSPGSIARVLFHPSTTGLAHTLVWDIRLPRILIGACVGAGLGVAGAMLQAMFRNPLVDPYITGVSAGAALTATAAIALGLSFVLVPAIAFAGGLACAAVVSLAASGDVPSGNLRLVLAGIAVSALCAAMVTVVLLRSGSTDSLTILSWLAGGISGRSWSDVGWTLAYLAAGFAFALFLLPSLNVLRWGADAAAGFGVRVGRARVAIMAAAALIAASCVAVSGIVGFVGLMAPHGARRLVGGDAAWLLPASGLAGAAVVIVADAVARSIFAPSELPLGVLLAFVGVPFFLIIARRPVSL